MRFFSGFKKDECLKNNISSGSKNLVICVYETIILKKNRRISFFKLLESGFKL